jgi:Fic family protein
MMDDNWETLNGPIANQIEVLNAANQINVLDGLIMFLLAHRGPTGNGNPPMPDETALCHLHHAGTLFLLSEPGRYRNIEVKIADKAGNVAHQPPPWQSVPGWMQRFFRDLSSVWTSGDALDVASYALWRINWIHPFRNGNGRTARAFCYACLSLKMGVVLPGQVTVVDQIMANRQRYQQALRTADDTYHQTAQPDLSGMKQFLHDLLVIQINSVVTP